MAERKKKQLPGDARLPEDALNEVKIQPLTEEQAELVKRGYALFRFNENELRERHEEMRVARTMREKKQDSRALTSAASNTLISCIDNVVADQIDNMPEALMIPEREETAQSAEELTDVVSYVLYQAGWQRCYQQLMEDATVTGTGVAEVFWDDDMENGDGMVNVIAWHPEDFYPDPMYEHIQDGRAVFKAVHTTVAWVEEHYPDAKGYVQSDPETEMGVEALMHAPYQDHKVTLIEFWYKRWDAKKKRNLVHMAQLAGGALLYSTELDYGTSRKGEFKNGVYAHGQYPFVMYKYKDAWRTPFGRGLVDDYKDTQDAIDRYLKYIDDNARQSSLQKTWVRKGGGVNIDDVADMSRTVVEYEGNDIRAEMITTQASPLNNQVFQNMEYLVDAMKQDCGQNQFTRGEGGLGVTAATAIQALQEAGGKITRLHTERYKFAFKAMIEQILWILSDYLEPERKMRIVGGWDSSGNMVDRVIELIAPSRTEDKLPKPPYTVRVQVQRNNPLQIQADNEFLTQVAQICAQNGTPLPPEAVIGLMEGYRTKSSVLKVVQANSQTKAMMEQLQAENQQLREQLDAQKQMTSGLQKALTTPGGASGQAQEQNAPDYSTLMKTDDEVAAGQQG